MGLRVELSHVGLPIVTLSFNFVSLFSFCLVCSFFSLFVSIFACPRLCFLLFPFFSLLFVLLPLSTFSQVVGCFVVNTLKETFLELRRFGMHQLSFLSARLSQSTLCSPVLCYFHTILVDNAFSIRCGIHLSPTPRHETLIGILLQERGLARKRKKRINVVPDCSPYIPSSSILPRRFH